MVYCPIGTVYLSHHNRDFKILQPFWIAQFTITQAIWEEVMGSCNIFGFDKTSPKESVTWLEAVEFCNQLSNLENLKTAYHILKTPSGYTIDWDCDADGYQLPFEHEWVFAAAALSNSEYAGFRAKI